MKANTARTFLFFLFLLIFPGQNTAALTNAYDAILELERYSSTESQSLGNSGARSEIGQMWVNPASLWNLLQGRTFSFNYRGQISGPSLQNATVQQFYLGYGWLGEKSRFAMSLAYQNYSRFATYSQSGTFLKYDTTNNILLGFSSSGQIIDKLNWGHTVKINYLQANSSPVFIASWDLGLDWQPFPFLNLGAGLKNLVSNSYRLGTTSETLPMTLQLSPTLSFWQDRIHVSYRLNFEPALFQAARYPLSHGLGIDAELIPRWHLRLGFDGTFATGGIAAKISQYDLALSVIPRPENTSLSASVSFNLDSIGKGPFARPKNLPASDTEEELMTFYEGVENYSKGEYKLSFDNFSKVLQTNPEHKLARDYRERALLHLRTSQWMDDETQRLVNLHRDLAQRYENQNNFGEAIAEWRKIQQLDPVSQEPDENISRIKEKVNNKVTGFHKQGLQHYAANDRLKAIESFYSALNLNPEYEPSKSWLVKIKQELSQEELAERENIEKLQKAEVFYNRGLNYFSQKSYDESIQALEQALVYNPDHENAKKYLAMAKEELEADRQGLRGLEAANKLYEKGMLEYNGEEYFKAIKNFNMALRAFPAHKEAEKMLPLASQKLAAQVQPFMLDGIAAYRNKQFSVAMAKFNAVLQLDPENREGADYLQKIRAEMQAAIDFHINEGNQNRQNALANNDLKLFSQAIYHYDEALKLDPDNKEIQKLLAESRARVAGEVEALHNLALGHYNAGRLPEALAEWKKALAIDPANALALKFAQQVEEKIKLNQSSRLVGEWNKRALELYQNRDYDRALTLLEKSLAADPANALALQYKDLCLKGKNSEALQEKISALFIAGVREYKKRNYLQAIASWQEVKSLDPQNALVERYIEKAREAEKNRTIIDFINGQKYMNEGKWLLAQDAFERALKENPKNEQARKLLQESHDRLDEEKEQLLQSGDEKMKKGDYEKAAQDYLAAYRLVKSPEISARRDKALLARQLQEEGLKYYGEDNNVGLCIEPFNRVLAINPFDSQTRAYLEKAIERGRTRSKDWLNQALRAEQAERFREAYSLYNSVISIDETNADAKSGISRTLKQLRSQAAKPYEEAREAIALKNYTLALEKLKNVQEILPDYEDTAALLESSRQELARKREKEAQAQKAPAQPGKPAVSSAQDKEIINEGIVLYRQGKYKEAIEIWNKVSKSSEEYSKAQKYVARAKLKL